MNFSHSVYIRYQGRGRPIPGRSNFDQWRMELDAWLEAQVGSGNWTYRVGPSDNWSARFVGGMHNLAQFEFRHLRDALVFKLTWGG